MYFYLQISANFVKWQKLSAVACNTESPYSDIMNIFSILDICNILESGASQKGRISWSQGHPKQQENSGNKGHPRQPEYRGI